MFLLVDVFFRLLVFFVLLLCFCKGWVHEGILDLLEVGVGFVELFELGLGQAVDRLQLFELVCVVMWVVE